jgi:hypothetical protein
MEWVVNAMPQPFYPLQWHDTHCVGGWVAWTDAQKRKFLATTGLTLLERFPVIRYAEGFSRPKKCRISEEFPCPILPDSFLTRWVNVSFSRGVLPHWVGTQLPASLIKEYSLLYIQTVMQRGSAMVKAAIRWSVAAEGRLQSPTSLYGTCGIQNGTGTGLSPSTLLFPFHIPTMFLTHLLIYFFITYATLF